MILLGLTVGYVLLLGVVWWQASQLRKLLPAKSWWWRKAAFTFTFIGLVARFAVGAGFRAQHGPLQQTRGDLELWVMMLLTFSTAYAVLICFAIEQHLLYRDMQSLKDWLESSHEV